MPKRELQGLVVSCKSQKTIVVEVKQRDQHAKYGKILTNSTKYHAHDEHGVAALGDTVLVVESRPISKMKRWALKQVVSQSQC